EVGKLSNKIMPKGLAFGRDWIGTVFQFSAPWALRDPAPPASWPRRGFGGAARCRHNRTEDLNGKIRKEASCFIIQCDCHGRETLATSDLSAEHRRSGIWLEANACHRDAAVTHRRNHCSHDGGHGLAAALGARLPRWRGP